MQSNPCRPGSKSELAYNEMPYTQTAIIDSYNIYCGPQSTIAEHAPLSFEIPGSEADFTDLSNTFLKLRIKVTTADGEPINDTNAPKLTLSNNVLNTLFSQVDISLNDTLVSQSSNLHGYRAYIENLLSYNSHAKDGFLQMDCDKVYLQTLSTCMWMKTMLDKYTHHDSSSNVQQR